MSVRVIRTSSDWPAAEHREPRADLPNQLLPRKRALDRNATDGIAFGLR